MPQHKIQHNPTPEPATDPQRAGENPTKHTPGPWRAHAMETRTIVAGRPGIAVALVDAISRNDEENDANFRLCVAAPELLEALKAVLEGRTSVGSYDGRSRIETSDERFDAARSAIAKAEGRHV